MTSHPASRGSTFGNADLKVARAAAVVSPLFCDHGHGIDMEASMTLRLLSKEALTGTSRHVRNETYETYRFLLAEDGLGVTVTDILLAPNIEQIYGYDQHVEIAYCIAGEAVIRALPDGQEERVTPGTMWVAAKGDRFAFRANVPTRLICVFTPPFSGHETGFAGDQ